MKLYKFLPTFLLCCLFSIVMLTESNAQDVILSSQADVNTYGATNPTTVVGNLTINGSDITDLTPLSTLTSVGGKLSVSNSSSLTNLDGLSGITSVGGNLIMQANFTTNLDGLSGITYVGGDLYVRYMDALTSFCGLYPLLSGGGLVGSYNVHDNATNPTEEDIINGSSCPPVPVELVSFTAEAKNGKVILNWQTATEVNNYGFEIHRQSKNDEWITLGFVDGHGNSNSPKTYSFADINPTGGSKFRYRLKQIDNDGTYEYSDIVEVEFVLTEFALYQNYPNPFNPSTVIKYQIPDAGFVTLKLYDVLGNEVATLVTENKEPGRYNITFDASQLSSGVYIYQLRVNDYLSTKKMVLLR